MHLYYVISIWKGDVACCYVYMGKVMGIRKQTL